LPTTSSPVPSSSQPKFWAVCPKRGECDTDDIISEIFNDHTVRCCSENELPGWKKNDGCEVWGRALLNNTCALDETHAFAQSVCEAAEARLCTKEELVAECTADTECGVDNSLAWSMTSAVQGPTSSPTSQTTGTSTNVPTNVPTHSASTTPTFLSTPSLPTTSSPVPSSSQPKFWAVCPKRGECDTDDIISEIFNDHTVRCCSENELPGWKKNDGCEVWGRALLNNTCALDETHAFAQSVCEAAEARLCTKEELVAECTADTECGVDNSLAWSMTSAVQGPTSSPTSQTTGTSTNVPTNVPTDSASSTPTFLSTPSSTTVPTVAPTLLVGTIGEKCEADTQGDSTAIQYWAACGRSGMCSDEPNGVFDYDTPHEVRCCRDESKEGWSKRAGCNVWTESKVDNQCYASKTFLEAECICDRRDGRLCTKEEIEGSCSQGTGCGFDNQVVWTSTKELTVSPSASPIVITIDEECASETQGNSTSVKHWALCGSGGNCNNEPNGVFDYDTPHEVRCCSNVAIEGWLKRAGCNVWTSSRSDGVCYASKNFFEAECLCNKLDGRLCTKEEIDDSCSQGTGCGFDHQVVWTIEAA